MIQRVVHVIGLGTLQLVKNGIPASVQLGKSLLVIGLAIVGNIKEAFTDLEGEIERSCQ